MNFKANAGHAQWSKWHPGTAMYERRLNLLAALVILIVPASGQSIGQIPVTQAGLVPAPGFDSLTPDHKVPPVMAATEVAAPAGESAWQFGRTFDPGSPQSQVMPGYVVRESEMPALMTPETYSRKGVEELSFHEHPGLRVGNFRNLNAKQAYAMFNEDERLQEIRDFKDTAHAIGVGGDSAEANGILSATDEAFARANDGPTPGNDIMDAPAPRVGPMLTNFEQMRLTWLEDRF
jgi:hypothetical protein